MNSAAFLSAVQEEIARLQQIQALLKNESDTLLTRHSGKTSPAKRKGGMTQAGRARVAEAQRKRWAAKKKSDAEAAATPASKRVSAPAKKAVKTTAAPAPSAKKAVSPTTKASVKKAATPAKEAAAKKSTIHVKAAFTQRRALPVKKTSSSSSALKVRSGKGKTAEQAKGNVPAANDAAAPIQQDAVVPSPSESTPNA